MRILKFGGTSLGNAQRLRNAADIVRNHTNCVVVCSAMAGVTNALEAVIISWKQGDKTRAFEQLKSIEENFAHHSFELFVSPASATRVIEDVQAMYVPVYELLGADYDPDNDGKVLALGELVTSYIFNEYLRESGTDSFLMNAMDVLHLNGQDEPDVEDIAKKILSLDFYSGSGIYVSQGFICLDGQGRVSNLKRGGSDYTATLFGAALKADAIEIWTDIDGLHNNDPRFVPNTTPVRELSFAEAAELAYFGAKILHPSCVRPAREYEIPILLKNTLEPGAAGTIIGSQLTAGGIKAISAKDNITVLRITSGRMFNAYGFLKRLFEVFDSFRLPVDVVTTSEVSVSVTIEDDMHLEALRHELSKLGRVSIEREQCIVCVVGDVMPHVSGVLEKVEPFRVNMVSLGASSNNITLVLPQENKTAALLALHALITNSQFQKLQPCTPLQA